MNETKKILKATIDNKNRLKKTRAVLLILLILLVFKLFVLQFVQGEDLSRQASAQQTDTRTLEPTRGIIYDANGKLLAISADVDTVSVNPKIIKYSDDTEVDKEFLAQSFSEIFGLDYTELLEKLNSANSYVTIASKVESDKIDALKKWMDDNKIYSGINIDSAVKRYYPYNTLASHVIGFTGTDHNGLVGLENSLDDILAGTPGQVVTLTDSVNSEIPNQQKSYIEPKNGSNVYLTIDVNIQSIAEKYLSQAVIDNQADSGTVIIIEPDTGNILAMCNYPDYNLNTPFEPTDSTILETWDALSAQEQNDYLYSMWNNTAVQSTYEPGSVFKIITAAVGLEENIVSPNDTSSFICEGYETINGTNIFCWRTGRPHGYQSLKQALANSCNPAFIQLGLKIGTPTLYKYYDAFGLLSSTNSDFYGESSSVFHNQNNLTDVDLAAMSFGQGITVTPLQLITAVSAIANEGVLMHPRIIDKIANPDTGAITTPEPVEVRQVVSEQTASELLEMLDYVVSDGTGKHADVTGYSIGGKSGTSENLASSDNTYVASFIGLSPTVNTQVVVLVALYNPKGDSFQGGEIAGPVVAQIFSEILPHLGVTSSATDSNSSGYKTTALSDLNGKTIKEAKQLLKSAGFTVHIPDNVDENEIVTNQMPKTGVTLFEGADVFLYTENSNVATSVTVPNFKGKTLEQCINMAQEADLNIVAEGSGLVVSQDVLSNTQIEAGSVINLTLKSALEGGY